ncbi:ABC transporter family substrate-binding protein [Diaminobutyricimonas sp. LJ205]|uniref:ABC transporter family substrate-binding protein n=1 Tax=Diaminobutyricimonas sp. LJ205 TaxID=2683590 RepID=UPI0012F4E394|nr:ABC transporter family substrate-binding protein [Diaminobutyricimonas sp. LJ205]
MAPRSRTLAAVASVGLAALLAGCTDTDPVVAGSAISVELAGPFTSLNEATGFGNTETNTAVAFVTGSDFVNYDSSTALVPDESFGQIDVVAEEPFTVRYTVNEDTTWSDGVPVDAADLLLSWAANSGQLNTPDFDDADHLDPETGAYLSPLPEDVVFFDGAVNSGLQNVSQTPAIGDDSRSITLVYDRYFADWPLAFSLGVPAHVVAREALGIEKPAEAKQAMVDAIEQRDLAALAPLATEWSTGFTIDRLREDPDRIVTSGPYLLDELIEGEPVTFSANPRYRGEHKPRFEQIRLHAGTDPLSSIERLASGELDVISPGPSAETADALRDAPGVTVAEGIDGMFEHLDFRMANSRNGAIENPAVRQALLTVLPRQQIVDALVTPVHEKAAPRDSFVIMPGTDGYDETIKQNGSDAYAHPDLRAAQQLLAEAGVSSPEVCVLFDPSNPRRVQQYELIRDAAAPAGIRITDCSDPDWVEKLGDPGAYDAALFGWRATNVGVTGLAARLHSTEEISNFSFYANPEVDALLAELATSIDDGRQSELLAEIDALLWADSYGAPLYQYPQLIAHSDAVEGISPSPLPPGVFWNVWEWQPTAS